MAYSPEDLARSLGFKQPQIFRSNLRVGAEFHIAGKLSDGTVYDYRYRISRIENTRIAILVNAEIGLAKIRDSIYIYPFVPNRLLRLPTGNPAVPPVYFSFISPSASEFNPKIGSPVTIAFGEVRDTVPPPPPK